MKPLNPLLSYRSPAGKRVDKAGLTLPTPTNATGRWFAPPGLVHIGRMKPKAFTALAAAVVLANAFSSAALAQDW